MAPSQVIEVQDLPAEFCKDSLSAALVHEDASWKDSLRLAVDAALEKGVPDVMASLMRDFETVLYQAALDVTHGKRILAAKKLGVGRNTLTRKLKELGIGDADT